MSLRRRAIASASAALLPPQLLLPFLLLAACGDALFPVELPSGSPEPALAFGSGSQEADIADVTDVTDVTDVSDVIDIPDPDGTAKLERMAKTDERQRPDAVAAGAVVPTPTWLAAGALWDEVPQLQARNHACLAQGGRWHPALASCGCPPGQVDDPWAARCQLPPPVTVARAGCPLPLAQLPGHLQRQCAKHAHLGTTRLNLHLEGLTRERQRSALALLDGSPAQLLAREAVRLAQPEPAAAAGAWNLTLSSDLASILPEHTHAWSSAPPPGRSDDDHGHNNDHDHDHDHDHELVPWAPELALLERQERPNKARCARNLATSGLAPEILTTLCAAVIGAHAALISELSPHALRSTGIWASAASSASPRTLLEADYPVGEVSVRYRLGLRDGVPLLRLLQAEVGGVRLSVHLTATGQPMGGLLEHLAHGAERPRGACFGRTWRRLGGCLPVAALPFSEPAAVTRRRLAARSGQPGNRTSPTTVNSP